MRALALSTLIGGLALFAVACDNGETDPTDDVDTDTDSGTSGVDGATVYANNCQGCHGADGTGTAQGADLTARVPGKSQSDIESVVKDGTGSMGPISSLDDDSVTAVAAYVIGEWGS